MMKKRFSINNRMFMTAILILVVVAALPVAIGRIKKAEDIDAARTEAAKMMSSQNNVFYRYIYAVADYGFSDNYRIATSTGSDSGDLSSSPELGTGGSSSGDSEKDDSADINHPTVPTEPTDPGSSDNNIGEETPVTPPQNPVTVTPTKSSFCDAIKNNYNVGSSSCSASAIAENTTDFKGKTPHIVFANGLTVYISNYINITALSDAEDTRDRVGFILFVDIDGSKGKSLLYEDVFPYYLTSGGKIIPGYKDTAGNRAGAVNKDQLSVNVIYDSFKDSKREVKLLMKDTNFKRAACATGYVKSVKYCAGDVQYELCKKDYNDCRFVINKPFKLF